MINKKKLSMILDRLDKQGIFDPKLEQYYLTGEIASDMLFRAYFDGDIKERVLLDIGTGNGILAIGAALLGAKHSYGMDIDMNSLHTAMLNAESVGVTIGLVNGNINKMPVCRIDCVIQNPPFGSQTKHADRPFLENALNIASTIYSFHNAKTVQFVKMYVESLGGTIKWIYRYSLPVPHMYKFHSRKVKIVDVVLCKIVRGV